MGNIKNGFLNHVSGQTVCRHVKILSPLSLAEYPEPFEMYLYQVDLYSVIVFVSTIMQFPIFMWCTNNPLNENWS